MRITRTCNGRGDGARASECSVVTVTPVVTVVSVVNSVSSMSDDAPPVPAEIDFAPHALPRPGSARAPPSDPLRHAHTRSTRTLPTRPSAVIYNSTTNNRKLTKRYQCINTNCHTRTFVTSMIVIFTMVIKYWSIPHNLFS